MKLYHITALVASFTGSAMAAMPTVLPEFKDEKQLATWRAEQQSAQASTAATAEAMAFYTGKPYLASAGGYAFKYRNYQPELARWTSEDPSGFPDGANNILYVNNKSINCIDQMGFDIFQITTTSGSPNGHTAMLSGSGSVYKIQSFGASSGIFGSSGNGGVTTQNFSSLSAAMNEASRQGYNQFNQWVTTSHQDTLARNAFNVCASNGYSVSSNNCTNAVTAGLGAIGVDHDISTNIPSANHERNSVASDISGLTSKFSATE
jgi:RHS repeat-associated protein